MSLDLYIQRKKIFKNDILKENRQVIIIIFHHILVFSFILELKRSILKHLMTYAFTLRFPICCHTAHLDFHVGGSYKNYFRMYSFYK